MPAMNNNEQTDADQDVYENTREVDVVDDGADNVYENHEYQNLPAVKGKLQQQESVESQDDYYNMVEEGLVPPIRSQ